MPRSVTEWRGKTPDTPIPPRVRLRVLDRFDKACGCCGRHIHPGDKWICDHKEAIILNGPNRENNLWPLCDWCAPIKDRFDVHAKSVIARKRMRHYGIRRRQYRPLLGTIASGWRHRMSGEWERR